MDREQLAKAFTATVQASLHGLKALEPVLRQEREALLGRDAERLENLAQQKLELLKQLEPGVQARDRLQRIAGLEDGLEGGGQLVSALNDATLTRDWEAMTELARSVAELNARNGQLATQGQRAARAALGILTGRSAHDDTYTGLRRKGDRAGGLSLGRV